MNRGFLSGNSLVKHIYTLFSVMISCWCGVLQAQQPEIRFDHLTANQGLSNSYITSITQDATGFIWIGTENGLNKFDGYQFTVYKHNPRDSTTIQDNSVWAMLVDSRGQLWIGTSKGLHRYDARRDVFINYKNLSNLRDASIDNVVRTITEDRTGNIWVGTLSGIGMVNEDERSIEIFEPPLEGRPRISAILEDVRGNLWVGSMDQSLFIFDREQKIFRPHPLRQKTISDLRTKEQRNMVGLAPSEWITALYEDSQGILWVATNDGLNKFDRTNDSFVRFEHKPDQNSISHNKIQSLEEDQDGNLWIGHLNGISIFNKERTQFTNYQYSIDNPKGLNNNYITHIYQDKTGNMWVGTRNSGLNTFYNSKNNFKLYSHEVKNAKSLNNNIVKAIVKDKKGRLWLGTDGGGLNLEQPDGSFIAFQHSENDPQSLPNNLVLALYEDSEENLWVSTFEGALSVLNKKTGKFSHLYPDPTDSTALRSASVSVMYEDKKHNFWIGTWYAGLHKLDRKTKTFTQYPFKSKSSKGLSSEKVLDIQEDAQGNLLIGTGDGLNIFNPSTGIFTHFVHDDDDKNSISDDVCNSICIDSNGMIWIGTNNGLNLFDRERSTFTVFGVDDGLPNETIQGVLNDDRGNLWLSTLKGICKFDTKTKQTRNYGIADGLQGYEFIPHSLFKSTDGVMFFGGNNGANMIDPRVIKNNNIAPAVVITNFKLFNTPVKVGGRDPLLTQHITFSNEIKLSYQAAIFSLEFAALNYVNPQDNQYAYKLEGLDEDWNHIGNNHIASYTTLDPGEYTFRVKASNNDGVWNERGAALKIIITPPFWETSVFKGLLTAALAMVAFLIFYVRIKNIKTQKNDLEQLVLQRTKEIRYQKEQIESQKENIQKQVAEITEQNDKIKIQNHALDEIRKEVKEKNKQLELYNAKLENTVKQRTKQLLQTNAALDQFVYRSAHDLKGPISRIMGLCYLGRLENPDKNMQELLRLMEQCSDEMSEKLTKLMAIHTINKKDVNLERIDYEALINEIINEVFSEHHVTRIKSIVTVQPSSEYKSDRFLVKKLLKNIIENAVKFSDLQKPDPYIKVVVNRRKIGTRILISDNGLGIPKGSNNKIFDMFVVSHETIKGFGLGLYEARLITRKLNGSIKLRDSAADHTEFSIVLPAAREGF